VLGASVAGCEVPVDDALDAVAERFSDTIAKHGPDAVAFYVSGQILTEDYYVANKLMKGFIGSANIDTNSRLCMSSAVAGYKRAFGSDTVPCCYDDLSEAKLLVLVGSNAAWTHPILYQRMQATKQADPTVKVVVIDPRQNATCDLADVHLPIKAGTDIALFNGLLCYLAEQGKLNETYIAAHTEQFDAALAVASTYDVETVVRTCGITPEAVREFYTRFANTPKTVTFYSQGVNQSSQGVDKCNAIINCHLATGRIGHPGMGPFSITGQPNAMGGREVGGLANMLAAHMDIENAQHRQWVQTFWDAPSMPTQAGLKAVDLFANIASGKVKAVWIMATNPVVSLPNRNQIEQALAACECVVVSECYTRNDTLVYADIVLPASTWSEKNGTVTNSERCISRQRGVVPPPGDARHDWQLLCGVAQRMGFANAFAYAHPAEIFAEHAALSGYHNGGEEPLRDFDISGLADLSVAQYDQLLPIRWPVNAEQPYGTQRMFSDGRFFTPSGKARFVPVTLAEPAEPPEAEYPFILNSGRLRDQWHTMTRTSRSATLANHQQTPLVSLHPQDVLALGLGPTDWVVIHSRYGHITVPFKADLGMRPGNCFVPIHWTQHTAPSANVSRCYSSRVDPLSGQPESKFVSVKLSPIAMQQSLQIVHRPTVQPSLNLGEYWARFSVGHGEAISAALSSPVSLTHCQQQWPADAGEWISLQGTETNSFTAILLADQQIQAICVSHASSAVLEHGELAWAWLDELLGQSSIEASAYGALLRHKLPEAHRQGRLVCSCFRVGENTINAALGEQKHSVASLGKALQCGTNCGSCKPELQQLIDAHGGAACELPNLWVEKGTKTIPIKHVVGK
jgi:assimilatory nitrate reductase catalytic subunit